MQSTVNKIENEIQYLDSSFHFVPFGMTAQLLQKGGMKCCDGFAVATLHPSFFSRNAPGHSERREESLYEMINACVIVIEENNLCMRRLIPSSL